MTPGKVQVHIGHVGGSREYMTIEIKDEESRIRVVEVEMSFEEFARSLTGQVMVDLPATFGDLSLVGKKMETKTEFVDLDYDNWSKKRFEQVVQPYEVDGWKADRETTMNHHKLSDKGYGVHFRRWI